MPIVAPSILAADFSSLGEIVHLLNESDADWIHVDVMDGHFVPNISFGFPILETLAKHANKPLDVHLMIQNPEKYLYRFKEAGAHRLIVHQEACLHLDSCLRSIRELDLQVGVAINPGTPIAMLEDVLHLVDQVCLMSVNPGFGGQTFIPNSLKKVRRLKEMILTTSQPAMIQIDGGVDEQNMSSLLQAGVDIIVAGSYIFEDEDPQRVISTIKHNKTRSDSKWV